MKRRFGYPSLIAALAFLGLVAGIALLSRVHPSPKAYTGPTAFWRDQCIDTMKTSRDRAREWSPRADLPALVDAQISLIAATGANCVAIDTPYDAEFLPVLRAWVTSARAHQLHIWFRGNFAGWEGWFDHPRSLTSEQLLSDTRTFIRTNPGLFANGDIFTAAPEAENGNPFKPAGGNFDADYRAFLVDQTKATTEAFADIHKQVRTNWASMSGGVARSTLDQATVDTLGGLVTLDHYVKTPDDMSDYLKYFHDRFSAKVVVGEWGAPIPEINGSLTPEAQSDFVTALLSRLAAHRDIVEGVNYWTLTGGSTALADDNLVKRPAYTAIKRYYSPTILTGTIRNQRGHAIPGAAITIDGQLHTTTDAHGNYALLSPSGTTGISIQATGYAHRADSLSLAPNRKASYNAILTR